MPVLDKEFLNIQATIEFEFTLKRIRDMIKTNSHILVPFEQYGRPKKVLPTFISCIFYAKTNK